MINLLVKVTFVERWKELDDIEYFDSLRGIDDEYKQKQSMDLCVRRCSG